MKDKEEFNILIVDDEVDLCESMAMMLELENYSVYQAHSGNEALKIVTESKHNIDFIISDIRMPDGTGDELLKEIRRSLPVAPVVLLMTGYSEFSNDDAIKEGAVGVFMKPIDFDQIISQIEVARGNS